SEVAAREHRSRKRIPTWLTALGEGRERRSAGVTEAQQFGGLVERFAGGIVLRLTQEPVLTYAIHSHQLRMAARDEERDERKLRPARREQRREQVALQVVDAKDRDAERETQGLGVRGADEQRARESRTFGVADAAELGHRPVRALKHEARERHESLDVVARGELGYDAAV